MAAEPGATPVAWAAGPDPLAGPAGPPAPLTPWSPDVTAGTAPVAGSRVTPEPVGAARPAEPGPATTSVRVRDPAPTAVTARTTSKPAAATPCRRQRASPPDMVPSPVPSPRPHTCSTTPAQT